MKRIVWINPVFLHYRVPVYEELSRMVNKQFYIVYSKARMPEDVQQEVHAVLGTNAIGLPGERIFRVGPKGLANTWIEISYQANLLKTVLALHPDIIIGEGFFRWTLFAYIAKLFKGIPVVVSYERTAHTERNSQWYRNLYRRLAIKYTDAFICNGKLSEEYLISMGAISERIVTGGMAADGAGLKKIAKSITETEICKIRKNWGGEAPFFIYVGSFSERKGVRELIESWNTFKNKDGRGTLVLVGDGPLFNEIASIVHENEKQNIKLIGKVQHEKMAEYYSAADLFIIPTLEDNWSLVVPEAMACGLPIACSKYNGCWPELVHDGVNGLVFDPLDKESMLNCFQYFVRNIEQLGFMGKNSQKIEAQFNPSSVSDAVLCACSIAQNKKLIKNA